MMVVSILLAITGVGVSNKTQLPVVSSYAKCVAHRVGAVSATPGERKAGLDAAIKACRAMIESAYAQGNFRMNGKPFPKSWWQEARRLFDAEDADVSDVVAAAPAGTSFKVMWELPDGSLVEVGDRFVPGTIRVRILGA